MKKIIIVFATVCSLVTNVVAQTDIHITGAQSGFPIAVTQFCDAGSSVEFVKNVPDVISRDLQLAGYFKLIDPASFIETPGKCLAPEAVAFSDWSVVGAEGLVRGTIQRIQGGQYQFDMYLFDVLQKRAVVGKRYAGTAEDYRRVSHRFANEITRYFTGELGMFGTRVAYVSQVGRFKELFVMDLDGANLRQVTKDNGLIVSPTWSPSGDRLVYTSYRSRLPEPYVTSSDGGQPGKLTEGGNLILGTKFTPNGGNLVASVSKRGLRNIAVLNLSGKVQRLLTSGGAIDVSPSLSPDGSQIVFCSNRGGGPQIYVMPFSGGDPKRVSYTGSSYCTSPAWSPKGDKIVFVCRDGGNDLFMIPTNSTQAVQLTFSGNNEDPTWSPDGRYPLFSSDFGGGPRNLALLPISGGNAQRITSSGSVDNQPAWSPRFEIKSLFVYVAVI